MLKKLKKEPWTHFFSWMFVTWVSRESTWNEETQTERRRRVFWWHKQKKWGHGKVLLVRNWGGKDEKELEETDADVLRKWGEVMGYGRFSRRHARLQKAPGALWPLTEDWSNCPISRQENKFIFVFDKQNESLTQPTIPQLKMSEKPKDVWLSRDPRMMDEYRNILRKRETGEGKRVDWTNLRGEGWNQGY